MGLSYHSIYKSILKLINGYCSTSGGAMMLLLLLNQTKYCHRAGDLIQIAFNELIAFVL